MRRHTLYLVFYIQTFIKKHFSQIAFGVLMGFFLTLFTLRVYPLLSAVLFRKHETVGIVGTHSWNNLPPIIREKISFGLTTLLSDGQATPAAAATWEVTNNLIYTFHLKPNLKWHNGKQFIAGDVNYKIKGSNITPIDNYTLKIELKEPYVPLPVFLTQPLLRDRFVGLGGFKVVKVIYRNNGKISQLTLLPFDKDLPTLTYKFYQDNSEALLGFKMGEIDSLVNIDSKESFKNWTNVIIDEKSVFSEVVTLFYNFKDSRFKEKEIRQALAYALHPFDEYDKAVSPISPFSWAYSQKLRLYKYDTDSAKKILSKSPLTLESSELVLTAPPSLLKSAQLIVDAWNKVGVKSKIKVDPGIPVDYQVILKTIPIPPDPDQYIYWQSTQENTNIANYSSPKIDKLLEDGRKTADFAARKKIYADFQFYLVDDAPAIFLYYPKSYTIRRK